MDLRCAQAHHEMLECCQSISKVPKYHRISVRSTCMSRLPSFSLRATASTKVLAKCKLEYYRISARSTCMSRPPSFSLRATASTKLLAKCKLKYYRISARSTCMSRPPSLRATASTKDVGDEPSRSRKACWPLRLMPTLYFWPAQHHCTSLRHCP